MRRFGGCAVEGGRYLPKNTACAPRTPFRFLTPYRCTISLAVPPSLFSRTIDSYVAGLRTAENAAVARGYAMALGVLPRKLAGESGWCLQGRPTANPPACARGDVRMSFFRVLARDIYFFIQAGRTPTSTPGSRDYSVLVSVSRSCLFFFFCD